MAAPIGGLLWGFGALALRVGVQWILAKSGGGPFDAFDRPSHERPFSTRAGDRPSDEEHPGPVPDRKAPSISDRFL